MPLRTVHLIHNQVVTVVIRCVAPLSGNLQCSETLRKCSPKNSYGSLRSFHVVPLAAKTTHQRATSIAFIYNTFVGPVLLYNAGSWGLNGSETDKLDAFHQKHWDSLRIINVKLYARCRCRRISTYIQNIVKTNEMPHSNVGYDWAFSMENN